MPTIPQLKQQKQQAFQKADQAGDAITPQQWGHVVGLMQAVKIDPQQSPQTAQIMQQLTARLGGNEPMSFSEMDQYREALAQTGEPGSQKLVSIIDDALHSMGATNPHLQDAIPASQQLRVREGLQKFLAAALSYKQQSGTDMLSAIQAAVQQQGLMEGLPPDDRKVIQNMLITGDTSVFSHMLNHDAGGQNGTGGQELVAKR